MDCLEPVGAQPADEGVRGRAAVSSHQGEQETLEAQRGQVLQRQCFFSVSSLLVFFIMSAP